jgi:tetratricopeptide (TPR) repeat protein
MAVNRVYRGHVDEAIQMLEQTVIANQLDGYEGRANSANHYTLSALWALKSQWERSEAEYQKATAESHKYDRAWQVWLLAYRVRHLAEEKVSQAEALLRKLADLDPDGDAYWFAKYWLDMAHKRYGPACEAVEKMFDDRSFGLTYMKGVAYLRAERYPESIAALSFCATMWSDQKTLSAVEAVLAHYYLGLAYEQTGEKNKAIEQLETFVDLWSEADPVFAEKVNDARRRLKLLHG